MDFIDHWDKARKDCLSTPTAPSSRSTDRAIYAGLGTVGKAPRGAVAYKYAAEEATTIVKRHRYLHRPHRAATPIATFDPVVVGRHHRQMPPPQRRRNRPVWDGGAGDDDGSKVAMGWRRRAADGDNDVFDDVVASRRRNCRPRRRGGFSDGARPA